MLRTERLLKILGIWSIFASQKDGKKKVTVKKSIPEVIVIDVSAAAAKQGERKEKKGSHASSSKKKAYSLTSVLSARSKIACGVRDIDAEDSENELSMMEYVEDLYKFYKHQENLCPPRDYMSSQIEINAKMRSILVDWLIEVHHKFDLMPETLYLTLFIIDRYLSMETVLRKELQLVGVSSMLIACKYEEIWAPAVHDFSCISDCAYSGEQILDMEKRILNRLDWSLTFPTSYVFLVRFLKAASSDKEKISDGMHDLLLRGACLDALLNGDVLSFHGCRFCCLRRAMHSE
ncbi:Cyclin-B1-1 [Platanthera zijinensis]|uniref:Cyclin-B1-1 n=1 Tax=Platanthera zijinensis TaxID=2320716 RepID=A0AAP0BMC9_9ASPA